MAHNSDAGREPLRQPDAERHKLSHRISNLSEISDFESNPYDAPTNRPPLHGRESMVSLDSRPSVPNLHSQVQDSEDLGEVRSPSSSWGGSFTYPSGGAYAPVSGPVGASLPARALSKLSRKTGLGSSVRRPAPETINEEEYDLSLLSTAAPIGGTQYEGTVPGEQLIAPGYDVTSYGGPTNAQDELFMRSLQEQEAKGNLTGGIGQGFRPDTRVRDDELLSSPIVAQRSLSRSFSRRTPSKRLGRAETIRHAGQDEANRRGEVIEVIVEEGAGADLSTIEGPMHIGTNDSRRSTMAGSGKQETTQIFYPQPNWKPFTMRWPYLTLLILVSIGLAGMEEILFQKYNKDNPLLKFHSPQEVEGGIYFAIKFAPTVFAVVYGVLWQFTDFEVRRLEAYYQMSKPEGALAAESINVDYVTSFSFFRPFRALKVGHYAVALSSMASTFAVSLVPTFAAASLVLHPDRQARQDDPDGWKEIRFDPVWSRLLTATLIICALGGCGLFYLLQSRRSGLLADVRGIAGLASMAVVSHVLMDFKDLDTAKPKDIHHKLKYYRYLLRNAALTPDVENPASNKDREKHEGSHLSENPHPLMLRPAGSIPFIISLLLFMGFIPAFLFTKANVVTDRASFVVTALAVALKLSWSSLETSVRMMEPYYILSRRHAPSKILTLDYTALPFGYMPIRALFNGHGLMFLLGLGTVMAEFLTILVTGLATVDGKEFLTEGKDEDGKSVDLLDSGQETMSSFFLSLALSLVILLYMFIVATIVFFRRRHPFMPRQPNTIASVLAFIHQSKMLYNFVGTNKLSTSEMASRLNDHKTYGLGWFVGRDGQVHCGVDQEELMNNYKHGVDAAQGNMPWNMQWDVL